MGHQNMRRYLLVALAAIALANVVTSSQATTVVRDHRTGPVVRDHRTGPEVRDHRTGPVVRDHRTGPEVRDHRQGGVEVRDHRHGPEVRDHRGDNAGTTVTSQPRPKKKVCLLGVVCTSNETVVDIADKAIPTPVIPR
jgi:hypothetical protein